MDYISIAVVSRCIIKGIKKEGCKSDLGFEILPTLYGTGWWGAFQVR